MTTLSSEFARFNKNFTPENYDKIKINMTEHLGPPPGRLCETPVFLTPAQYDDIVQSSKELIAQAMQPHVVDSVEPYVMEEFKLGAAERPAHPSVIIVDFAMTQNEKGELAPKLVEMQSSSSMFLFMMHLAESHKESYGLGDGFEYLPNGGNKDGLIAQLRDVIVGDHDPKHVVLLELEPPKRASLPDFKAFQEHLGITYLDVHDIIKHGNKLYYKQDGEEIEIKRVYNRVIPEDFAAQGLGKEVSFSFTEKLDVEWISHPHWDFLMSKASLPFMEHKTLPKTYFLDQVTKYPDDLENYVLKPLFSYGGQGVQVNITAQDLDAVPADLKKDYVLMEKIKYAPFIESPDGDRSKAEIRLMFTWNDARGLEPAIMLARVTRGDKSNMTGAHFGPRDNWIGVAPVMKADDAKIGNMNVDKRASAVKMNP